MTQILRTPLSPILLLSCANAFIDLGENAEAGGAAVVRMMLRGVGQPDGSEWHTAFVHHVGYWSHYDNNSGWSTWPLPATNDPNVLARFAEQRRILSVDAPTLGEVVLTWSPARKRFVHAGIVAGAWVSGQNTDGTVYFQCPTIDGNTFRGGKPGGGGIHRSIRQISPDRGDRFVRWVDLDGRASPAEPVMLVERCAGRVITGRAA